MGASLEIQTLPMFAVERVTITRVQRSDFDTRMLMFIDYQTRARK
jgi:hypothetical protein